MLFTLNYHQHHPLNKVIDLFEEMLVYYQGLI
jgi:hypothetical protein